MCDRVREEAPDAVAVLAGTENGKAVIAAAAGKEALAKGVHAGRLAGGVAKLAGGNGGGKPDLAMAGAKNLGKLEEALASAEKLVSEMLK
jgi:alanyl-tRNA synthetase